MSADNERRARELMQAEYKKAHAADPKINFCQDQYAVALRAIMAALDEPAGSVGGEAVDSSRVAQGQRFIEWNRSQPIPYVRAGYELVVFDHVQRYTHPAPVVVDEAVVQRVAGALSAQGWATGGDDDEFLDGVRAAMTLALTQPSQPGEEGE